MSWIVEATTATFVREVVERSLSVPVLVDFWAAWCNPCRVLGPILEQAVGARQGDVVLVKIDTDQNQALAQQLGIQGIPAVKAFVDGRVVDEFVGVLERREVDAFIDKICPSAEERALRQSEHLLAQGEADQVSAVLEPALGSREHGDKARLLLARAHLAQGQHDQVLKVLDQIDTDSMEAEQVESLRIRTELLRAAGQAADVEAQRQRVEQAPADADARWALAGALLAAGKHPEALDALLELLQRDRQYRDDGARRAMLAIFDQLGADSDLAREYRRKLQIYI
jgi:putative thioredoxin